MQNRTFVLADGENLVFRYQDSLAKGDEVAPKTFYIQDVLVWHCNITRAFPMEATPPVSLA